MGGKHSRRRITTSCHRQSQWALAIRCHLRHHRPHFIRVLTGSHTTIIHFIFILCSTLFLSSHSFYPPFHSLRPPITPPAFSFLSRFPPSLIPSRHGLNYLLPQGRSHPPRPRIAHPRRPTPTKTRAVPPPPSPTTKPAGRLLIQLMHPCGAPPPSLP